MYESFYGLKEKPFAMLPDPGFLYLSKKHQMALTLLEYGLLNQAGFCVVSGETGSGKTTLLRKLLENIDDDVTVGMITNTHKGFGELLDWVLSAFGIHGQGMSTVDMHQRFMDFLVEQYAASKTTLLIVDEAQNMTVEKLEELRMLSNVNSEKDQVLQVILAGQPELKATMQLPELRQFAQRIGVDHHLSALNEEETKGYIEHRLSVAGATREIFTEEACEQIHEYSGGTPRLINLLCDTVMVYGFADQQDVIDEDLVDEMVQERMKDSIVPLASTTPSKKKKSKKKKAKKKQVTKKKTETEKVKPIKEVSVEEVPIEEAQNDDQLEYDAETEDTRAVIESFSSSTTPNEEELNAVANESAGDKASIYDEAVESIEEMASESTPFNRGAKATIENSEEDQDDDSDVRKREPNFIEILEPDETPETEAWKWGPVAVIGLIVISVLVFLLATGDPDDGKSSGQSSTASQEVSDDIKRQLEDAEKARKELARKQEEDRARMKALEKQATVLQRERDEARANVAEEKKKRAADAAAAKAAAKNQRQAQKAAESAIASERKTQIEVQMRAEEAVLLEQKLLKQREQLRVEEEALAKARAEAEARAQVEAEAKAKTESVAKAKKEEEQSFKTDPCASSTARFLSTCR